MHKRIYESQKGNRKLLAFLLALFFALWLYPRLRGGGFYEFAGAECLSSKLPPPVVVDICGILYYLTSALIVYLTLMLLKKEDICHKREVLIRSVLLCVSGDLLMMFFHPFLSVIPDATLALCSVSGASAVSAVSVEYTKEYKLLTFVKTVNLLFLACLLYVSLIYELIA